MLLNTDIFIRLAGLAETLCSWGRKQRGLLLLSQLIHIPRMVSLPQPCLAHPKLRKKLIYREDTVGKAYMYFSSEQLHYQFIFIAVFQLNALVSLCSAFCFLSEHCFPVTPRHVQKKASPEPTYLWLKCCVRTSLPFSTKTSRMWMALIFLWAFP